MPSGFLPGETKEQRSARIKASWTPERKEHARQMALRRWARVETQAEEMEAMGAETGEQSASTPSEQSKKSPKSSEALPQALPGGKYKPRLSKRQAEEMLMNLAMKAEGRESQTTTKTPPEETKKPRRLPSDPDKRARKLSLARIPARMPVLAINEVFRGLEMRPLSEEEKEEGIEAFAALFWYYGFTDPRVMCLLWVFGIGAPRFVDWLEDRKRVRAGQGKLDRSNWNARAMQHQVPGSPLQAVQNVGAGGGL